MNKIFSEINKIISDKENAEVLKKEALEKLKADSRKDLETELKLLLNGFEIDLLELTEFNESFNFSVKKDFVFENDRHFLTIDFLITDCVEKENYNFVIFIEQKAGQSVFRSYFCYGSDKREVFNYKDLIECFFEKIVCSRKRFLNIFKK